MSGENGKEGKKDTMAIRSSIHADKVGLEGKTQTQTSRISITKRALGNITNWEPCVGPRLDYRDPHAGDRSRRLVVKHKRS